VLTIKTDISYSFECLQSRIEQEYLGSKHAMHLTLTLISWSQIKIKLQSKNAINNDLEKITEKHIRPKNLDFYSNIDSGKQVSYNFDWRSLELIFLIISDYDVQCPPYVIKLQLVNNVCVNDDFYCHSLY